MRWSYVEPVNLLCMCSSERKYFPHGIFEIAVFNKDQIDDVAPRYARKIQYLCACNGLCDANGYFEKHAQDSENTNKYIRRTEFLLNGFSHFKR